MTCIEVHIELYSDLKLHIIYIYIYFFNKNQFIKLNNYMYNRYLILYCLFYTVHLEIDFIV